MMKIRLLISTIRNIVSKWCESVMCTYRGMVIVIIVRVSMAIIGLVISLMVWGISWVVSIVRVSRMSTWLAPTPTSGASTPMCWNQGRGAPEGREGHVSGTLLFGGTAPRLLCMVLNQMRYSSNPLRSFIDQSPIGVWCCGVRSLHRKRFPIPKTRWNDLLLLIKD